MVAVVSGNGLGLFNTSLTGLGGLQGGPVGLGGRSGSQVVNITNGNLILQDQDENLSIRGFNAGVLRTYNSRGTVAGMGQDGFVTGYERRVALTSGVLNAAGSQMTLTTGDGQAQVFTYSSANTYISTAGDGAHDTLVWSSGTSTWTMTEGSSRREEQYANHADTGLIGRLIRIRDLKSDGTTPAQFDVIYNNATATARITEIRSIDGQATATLRDAILFGYDGSNRLSSITTREGGVTKSQVSYGYDAQSRLSWVQQDLTPTISGDGTWDAVTLSNNNGLRFRTTYSYVTTTASDLRIASVTQSDGATVSYTYEADGAGGFRVKTVTQGSASDGSAQTVTFTYNGNSTTVTDSLGRSWIYTYDAAKQLTSIQSPAVEGQSDLTSYSYDTLGNLTQVKTERGSTLLSQINYTHDANGNVLGQWTRVGTANASADAVIRTYTTANQLATEIRYTGLDTDAQGAVAPTGTALTSRYYYDSRNRLQWAVNPANEVTEFTYATTGNGIGQVASERRYFGAAFTGTLNAANLSTWATAAQKASSQLTEFVYDAKGRLQQSVSFAAVNASGVGVTTDVANDITSYSYDAQGLLLQKIVVRGAARTTTYTATPPTGSEVSSYVYDGMGRLLSVLKRDFASAATDALSVSTTYAYTDSVKQIVVTLDSGATRTETRNLAGQTTLVALAGSGQTARTTQNFFDSAGQLRASQDASGARRYFFYDNKGRLEAEVDATGAVMQYVYDGADRRLSTVQYATRVTTTSWLSGGVVNINKLVYRPIAPGLNAGEAWVQIDISNDRTSTNTFDAAGRVLTTTDGDAANANRQITTYTYDAASRVTLVRTTDSVGTAATAREMRQVYDNAGRVIAKVDAQNFVTEYTYDSAGRLVRTTVYANASASPSSAVLTTLRPTLDATNDQTTRYFYNGRGQQVGTLDALGYLTEAIVDEAGNTRAERRYGAAIVWASGDTLTTLRNKVPNNTLPASYRESKSAYNALGQLFTQTNFEGTVTKFTYDEAGRLVRTQTAENTSEVREGFKRYNVFDEVIGEISGEQVAQAEAFLGGQLSTLNETQLNTAYTNYGITHSYDAMSRRIESRDAQGNKTFYFYDSQGRQTFTVKGVAQDNAGNANVPNSYGEVTETRYSAFGQVIDSIAYTGRIAFSSPGDRASVEGALSVLSFVAASDTRRQFMYDQRGLLKQSIDALSVSSTYNYTAFGQLNQEVRATSTTAAVTIQHNYDKRGLATSRVDGVGTSIARTSSQTFDAFGRVTSSTDARGAITNVIYDRLGRQITRSLNVTSEGTLRTETTTMAYDAFSQTVSMTDALNNTTNYVYSDVNRSLRVTSQEGVVVTTTHNRFGQIATVSQVLPDGTTAITTYTYDKNGFLLSITNPLGQTTSYTPDVRGLLYETTDASGRKVRYSYDAVGRVLTRSEDPAGLNFITTTSFDGQGRQVKVTDASARITTMSYDQEGRLLQTAQDPSGLNLRTSYTYDAAGRQIDMIEGVSTASARTTRYVYDELGRRIQEKVDPNGLNLTTQYLYDANDNVVQRTDATGNISRFVYDEANRRIYDIDATGGVSKTTYDKNGQVIAVRSYATAIIVSDLPSTAGATAATIKARVDAIANEAIDQISYRVLDRDNRVRFSITNLSSTTASISEQRYDSAGRAIRSLAYVAALTDATVLAKIKAGTAVIADFTTYVNANEAGAQRQSSVYDAAGRIRFSVDALGNVTEQRYDAAGRVVQSLAYAVVLSDDPLLTKIKLGTATLAEFNTFITAHEATAQRHSQVYDAAGRLRYTVNALGELIETSYDAAGRVTETLRYTSNITLSAALKTKLQSGDATALADIKALLLARTTLVWDAGFDSSTLTGLNNLGFNFPLFTNGEAEFNRDASVTATRAQAVASSAKPYLSEGLTYSSEIRIGGSLSGSMLLVGIQNEAVYKSATFLRDGIYVDNGVLYRHQFDAAVETKTVLMNLSLDTVYIVETETASEHVSTFIYAKGSDRASGVSFTRTTTSATYGTTYWYAYNDQKPGVSGGSVYLDNASATTRQHAQLQANRYDAAGRLIRTLDALGNATEYGYDAAGRRISVTDARGNTSYAVYDSAGRAKYSIDALGTVSESVFDAAGRVTAVRRYANAINLSTTGLIAKLNSGIAVTADLGIVADAARDQVAYTAYDQAGRAKYSIDAFGAVTENYFDAKGFVTAVRRYANAINIGAAGLVTKLLAGSATTSDLAITADANRDQMAYMVYDAAGRVRFDLDAQGNITEKRYDALGRVVEAINYIAPISLSDADKILLANGSMSIATLVTRVSAQEINARANYQVFDAASRVIYSLQRIDATNVVVREWRYDAMGRVVADIQYANTIAYTPSMTQSQISGAISPEHQRISQRAYDVAGQLRFVLDDQGMVVEYRYNAIGQVTDTLQYLNPVTVSVVAEADVMAAVSGQTGYRKTSQVYDSAGRLLSSTDALNQVEYFAYNATGDRVRFTNKLGNTWTYFYDAAGRQTEERSPSITVGYYDTAGVLQTRLQSIITRIVYDVFGNVISRTENANAPLEEQRATSFIYDRAGRRIKTIYPDAYKWDVAANGLVAIGSQPSEEVIYNALGQAVVNKDVRGNYSYKVYDNLGRLVHDIDQEGYITSHSYNAYDEQIAMTRYANKQGSVAGWTSGTALSVAQVGGSITPNSDADRSVLTQYDRRGLKVQVQTSAVNYYDQQGLAVGVKASPTTMFEHDAFGQLVKESVQLDINTWATTFHYYDDLGRKVISVDSEGYFSQWIYNSLGEVTDTIEYARAVDKTNLSISVAPNAPVAGNAATGFDRIQSFSYDALGRKITDVSLRHYHTSSGGLAIRSVQTTTEYDATGNVTAIVADGQRTETAYDAVGRIKSLTESARDVLASNWQTQLLNSGLNLSSNALYVAASPYTETLYDAFGSVIKTTRFANGKQNGAVVTDALNDQVTSVRYDRQGRAVVEKDAENIERYTAYDLADNVISKTYRLNAGSGSVVRAVSSYNYDRLGRQISTNVTRQSEVAGALQGTASTDTFMQARYNAFGEIIAKGNDSNLNVATAFLPEQYQYDAAGRMIRTNSQTGAYRDYGYNLAGHQLVELRSVYTTGPSASVINITQSRDSLGRSLRQNLPLHGTLSSATYVHQQYDRWGNTTEETDPRGLVVRMEYNELNQLVREVQPLVKVVSETGEEVWTRPEQRWFYDVLGRYVGMKDANGNIKTQEYDAAGRQIKLRDSFGNVTRSSYDALGRVRAKQDALGYISYENFDRLSRITSQGDFLLNTSSTARTQQAIQTYVLNQNGDRISVKNALNHMQLYDFNSQQQMLRSQTAMGAVTTVSYDLNGRKIMERGALYNAASTAVTVGNNELGVAESELVRQDEQTWDYDYFGRVIDQNDLGTNDYNFYYNAASGQLIRQTSTSASVGTSSTTWGNLEAIIAGMSYLTAQSQDRSFKYYQNGLISEVKDLNGGLYKYEYDANGNRTLEETQTIDGRGTAVHSRTRITYDSHNRIQRVTNDNVLTNVRTLDMLISYDAQGNRRHVVAQSDYTPYSTSALSRENIAPIATASPNQITLLAGEPTQFYFRGNELFHDLDGDRLQYSVRLQGGSPLPAWLVATQDLSRDLITFNANADSLEFSGSSIVVEIVATDTVGGGQVVSTFTVSVSSNSAPVTIPNINLAMDVKTGKDWSLTLNVSDYFSDADIADSLVFDLYSFAPYNLPTWLSYQAVSNSQIRLFGTPTASDIGSFVLMLSAKDRFGQIAAKPVLVNVAAPSVPLANQLPAKEITIGAGFFYEIPLQNAFNPNGSTIQNVSLSLADGSPVPAWMGLENFAASDSNTLRFVGEVPSTLTVGQTFTVKITVTTADGVSVSTNQVFTTRVRQFNLGQAGQSIISGLNIEWVMNQSGGYAIPDTMLYDPNGEPLIFSLTTEYWWQNPIFPEPIPPLPTWLHFDAQTKRLYGTPPATQHNYELKAWIVTVDVAGLTVYMPLNIKISGGNEPPKQLLPIVLPSAVVGQNWTYTVPSGAFTDPDGGALTYSAHTMPYGATSPVPLPSWLSFNATSRTFMGTPPTGAFGENLELLVTDSTGGTLKVSIPLTINSANQAPTVGMPLTNQSAVRGGSWTYQIPANTFSDPEGYALAYSAKQANGATLPSGLTFNAGTKTFSVNATVATGIYNIRVTATDASGSGAWVTSDFTLVISPTGTNPPVLKYPIPDQNVKRGTAWSYTFPSYLFADPENTALNYSATLENGSALPSWLSFASGTARTFNATSSAVQGTYRVRVRAQDGSGAWAISVFTLTVHASTSNTPISVINPVQDQSITQLSAWSFQLPANIFRDIENQVLFVGEAQAMFYSPEISMGLPEGLTYNSFTRTISGTALRAGTWTVYVSAITAQYEVAETTFKIIVNPSASNTAPTSPNPIANQSGDAGQAWQFTVPANTFNDPQGQTLRYSAIQSNGNLMPEWLQFDSINRRFYGTPAASGVWTLRVKAEDPHGLSTYRDFTFTAAAAPANLPPILNAAIGTRNGERNGLFAFTVPGNTFSDANGNALTYSASGLPSWLSFDSLTRTFYGVPPSLKSYSVTLVATDPSGASASNVFTININATAQTQGGGSGLAAGVTGVVASSTTAVSHAAATTSGPTPEQYWFTYDSENRAEIINGQLVNGLISLQSTDYIFNFYTPIVSSGAAAPDASYALRYDAVGRVVAQIYASSPRPNIRVQHSIYDQRGQLTAKFETDFMLASASSSGSVVSQSTTALWWSGISERRIYDAAGRLLEIREYYTWNERAATQILIDTSHKYGWLQRAQVVTYNNDNQVLTQQTFGRTDAKWYDAVVAAEGSNIAAMISNQTTNRNVLNLLTTTTNTVRGDGLLTHMKFQQHAWEPDTQPKLSDGTYLPAFIHDFDYTYLKRQAYLESTVTGSSTDSRFKPATTTSMYDAYGRRIAVKEHAKAVENDVVRYFAYDANEGIVNRRDGWLENGNFVQALPNQAAYPLQRNLNFVSVNGQQVAKLSQAGEIDIISHFTAYESGSNTQGYVVLAGDTLQSIAQRVYGNSSLWYVVASANSVNSSEELVVGMRLRTPELQVTSNDSNTLKPYNANDIIGATTPNLPFVPPAKTGCIQTAAIIFSVVIRIVTIIAAAYLVATGNVGAARWVAGLGEVAAQGLEVAAGLRENFNWLDIAGAAVQGGLAAPTPPISKTHAVWRAVVRAAGNYAAGYIQERLQGNDPSFSWKALAASVVASAIGEAVLGGQPAGPEMAGQTAQRAVNKSPTAFNWATVAKEAAKAVARSAIDYAARKAIVGEATWNWRSVAANALGTGFGQAIGEFVVGRMEEQRQEKMAKARKDEEQQRSSSSPQYDPNSAYDRAMAEAANRKPGSPFGLDVDGGGDLGLYGGMSEDWWGGLTTEMPSDIIAGDGFDSVYAHNAGPRDAGAFGGGSQHRLALREPSVLQGEMNSAYAQLQFAENEGDEVKILAAKMRYNDAELALGQRPSFTASGALDLGIISGIGPDESKPDINITFGGSGFGDIQVGDYNFHIPSFQELSNTYPKIFGNRFVDGVNSYVNEIADTALWAVQQNQDFWHGNLEKTIYGQATQFLLDDWVHGMRSGFQNTRVGKYIRESSSQAASYVRHPDKVMTGMVSDADHWLKNTTPKEGISQAGFWSGENVIGIVTAEAGGVFFTGGMRTARLAYGEVRAATNSTHYGSSIRDAFTPINPSGRMDNCVAGVCANITNKMQRNSFEDLVNANQIESRYGYTGREREFSEQDALSYIENATGTARFKVPLFSKDAPVGNYVVTAESRAGGRGHVVYGQKLPNGRSYIYDPQINVRYSPVEFQNIYTETKSYWMKPK